jgi:hypothetical protein
VPLHRLQSELPALRGVSASPGGLRERLLTLATLRPRWGYRRLHWLLRREGQPVNRKRIYRLYRELGLVVRRQKRKRIPVARRCARWFALRRWVGSRSARLRWIRPES